MVILDSDHSQSHVEKELKLFAPLVTLNSYLIVEDTNINGHPAYPSFGPGPYEAVETFLRTNDNFEVDSSREKFLMTFNPKGYLKRVR
jgi:cephalosporin hydroxylase